MKKENFDRSDNILRIISGYKNQMACLIDIIDKLKELNKDSFGFDKLIKEIFPIICEAISDVSVIFIIRLSHDGKITLTGNNNYQLKANASLYEWNEEENLFFRNYEDHPFNISSNPAKEAVCISHLCKLPITDELYFLVIIRKEERKPFLSHELQAIKIYTRLVGGFINSSLANEMNRYMLTKDLSKNFFKKITKRFRKTTNE
jgi:hypothetical protein